LHDCPDDGGYFPNEPKGGIVVRIRNLLILLAALLAAYGILVAVAELPPYGMPDNPVHNQVSERYINEALDDTGVLNMVTAIVLDYRAYDTMFETIVLFTATLAVVITLRTSKSGEDGK
jgi:multicomponent Na+:H+ antiporter subunit B